MAPLSLVKLINSLSGSEKRYFKLQSKMQSGEKEYLKLFELIDNCKDHDIQKVKVDFKKCFPDGSWENTCIYLGNQLIDSLVRAKKEKDVFFDLLHQLQEIKILKERSLDEEAFKQIKKVQKKAAQFQMHWIEYYCHRYELNHHADKNFSALSDDELIKLQMKGKDVLKSLNHIHDHYALYEMLKHRLVHVGKIVSEEGKKKLNDLLLSEMVLISGKGKSFTSQKLHLLFQSFFFTDIGDYRSALKSFYQLNELLEKNEAFLDNPPLDYLSALTGIIDSLRILGNNDEIIYYLNKIKMLDQIFYPEFFRYLVRKTFHTEQIIILLQSKKVNEAKEYIEQVPTDIFDSYKMVDEEKQSELYFYCSLVYFEMRNYKKAHLFVRGIMTQLRLPEHLLISKAIRLINIVIYYAKGDLLHLEYEVRSYKRYFLQTKLFRTEKLLFAMITASLGKKRMLFYGAEYKRITNELESLCKDPYEQRLLKYFDFARWIQQVVEAHSPKISSKGAK